MSISPSVDKYIGVDKAYSFMGGNFLRNQALGHAVRLWAGRGPSNAAGIIETAEVFVKYIDEGVVPNE